MSTHADTLGIIPIKLIRIAEIFLISAYLMSEYASYLVFCILRELCRINQAGQDHEHFLFKLLQLLTPKLVV